jgi:signal transduction histidine kinase
MSGARANRKPRFLWQGALILLPLVLVSGLGIFAIWRDQQEIEMEARRRAAELADQLGSNFSQQLPTFLTNYDLFSLAWSKHYSELARSPLGLQRDDGFQSLFSEWQRMNPKLNPDEVLPNQILFDRNGVMIWPGGDLERQQTPAWFVDLTPEQRKAWGLLADAASSSAATHADVESKLRTFLDTQPTAEARVNAEFVTFRMGVAHASKLHAIDQLEQSASRYTGFHSESGLPLLSLMAADALRLIPTGPDAPAIRGQATTKGDEFHDILSWILDEPSSLSPLLLDQLQTRIENDSSLAPRLRSRLQAAKLLYQGEERACEVGERLQQSGFTKFGSSQTNGWIDAIAGEWFCRSEPGRISQSHRREAGVLVPSTNDVFGVRIYPRALLEAMMARTIENRGIFVPEYFQVNLSIEDKTLSPWPARFSDPGQRAGELRNLADSQAYVASISSTTKTDHKEMPDPDAIAAKAESNGPLVRVRVALTSPRLLFASQERRILMIGALILASSFAACVGVAAAYRSFRRQLRLNELKSNFVSSVSHELRAPIASVRLMAESLERGTVRDSKKQNEYFQFIVQECRRLSSLIENVLDFSRIEQGRKQFEFEPTDVLALARQTVKLMEPYATERKVALELQSDCKDCVQINADGKAIQQALINLIDNAIKHSPPGEMVRIGLDCPNADRRRERNSVIALWVEDRGQGIPAEEHEKIFERFYRLGSELRRQTQGVGIGLSIVKHVVEAHGGRVLVRSSVGQGSRFTIELPFQTEHLET